MPAMADSNGLPGRVAPAVLVLATTTLLVVGEGSQSLDAIASSETERGPAG